MELNSSNETTTTEYSINYSTGSTTIPSESSTPLLTTTIQATAPSSDNPIGIKIKEITKPEEIRITDDRPKVFKTIKSSEAMAPITSSALLNSQETVIEPEHQPPIVTNPDEMSEIQAEIEPEIEQHSTFSFDDSADQPIQLESTDINTLGHVSTGPKIVRQTDIGIEDGMDTTISPFSSENEIRDEILTTKSEHVTDGPIESTASVQHNTSVLQVGDSVVIFDRSGQSQSIPLRVAGLQRGEDTYDEEDERKEVRITEESMRHSTEEPQTSSLDPMYEHSTTTTTEVFEVYYYEPQYSTSLSLDFPIGDVSGDGSGELDNIVASTEKLPEDNDTSSGYSPIDTFTDPMLAQPSTVDERTLIYLEGSPSTSEEISTNLDSFDTSTSSSQFYPSESTTTTTTTDAYDEQHDQNINFPHITDDLSIHGSRLEDRMEDEDKLRVNSRVVESELDKIEVVRVEPLEQNVIRTNDDSSSTLAPPESVNESTNFKDVEGRSPGEPLLIPEWERNHTTVAPFELIASSSSNDTAPDQLLAEISSHDDQSTETVLSSDDTTTNQSDVSSTTDLLATNPSTSESGYEVESTETQSTSGPSQVKETNNFQLFLDGTADFFRIQKKIWDTAVV